MSFFTENRKKRTEEEQKEDSFFRRNKSKGDQFSELQRTDEIKVGEFTPRTERANEILRGIGSLGGVPLTTRRPTDFENQTARNILRERAETTRQEQRERDEKTFLGADTQQILRERRPVLEQQREERKKLRETKRQERKEAKAQLDVIEPQYRQALKDKDATKIRELGAEVTRLKGISNPFAFGLLEGSTPLSATESVSKSLGQDRDFLQQVEQQPGFRAGEVTSTIGRNIVQYSAINSALSGLGAGTKLGKLLGDSARARFVANQGVDLLADTIVQTPIEAIEAIQNEDSLGEFAKDFAINRGIDVLMNAAIGVAGEGIKALKKADIDKLKKVAQDFPDKFKQSFDKLGANQKGFIIDAGIVPKSVPQQIADITSPTLRQQSDSFFNRNNQRALAERQALPETLAEQPIKRTPIQTATVDKASDIANPTANIKERGFSENIRTDKAIAPEANAAFDKDPEFYNVLENATTLEKAQARFDVGYEKALEDFERTKNTFTPDNVVLAKLIANEAAVRGDLVTMRRVLADTAETLTQAGQYSQAAKILREGNDPATIYNYIQKELDKLNEQGKKQLGKKWDDIKLSDDDLRNINQMGEGATDQQKQELFEKIYESISQRIPTTNMEKFDAWRRIAMLTNPKTHIRNIAGNTLMAGVKRTADTIATGFEKLIPKSKRTKAVFVDKELKQIASDYFDANAKQLTEGSRWEVFGVKSPFADKRIFDNEVLEWINNFSKNTLEQEDIFFLKRHFQRDLAGFMQARGLKKPTQEAVDYALRRAQEATFREANDFATALNKMKGNKSFGKLVDAAMPFTKTPANILKTGLDYSPQGVVNAIFKITKGAEPQEVIEILSKGLTGTGIALAGYYLGKNGIIRGDYRGAKEESLLQRAGVLPNSLILPNGSYTIDWAQPAAIPLFMGVAFAEELNQAQQKADATDENIDYIDAYTNALFQSGETLINQSMLRGISDLFGGFGTTTEKIAGLPIAYLEQGIPTILGQIARTTDPNKRQRDYSNVVDKAVTSTISKIPIYSKSLPKKFDLLGAEQVYGEGLANAFQQFLSPGYVGTDKGNRLTKELLRLYNEVGSNFLPRVNVKDVTYDGVTYEFTPEEVADFQKAIGKLTSDALNQLFKRNDYLRANDEDKAKMIKKVDSDSYYKAKQDYLKKIGVLK